MVLLAYVSHHAYNFPMLLLAFVSLDGLDAWRVHRSKTVNARA